MARDPFDALRLALMQEVLPLGLGAAERVRKGGPGELWAAFAGGEADPLSQLREEGEPAASRLREQLDQVSPGLGNPVLKVEVRDVAPEPEAAQSADPAELQERLQAMEERLRLLEQRLLAASDPT